MVSITPQALGPSRLTIDFGTGRKVPQTNTASAQFATGAQSLYGIWDWNMANWNSASSVQFWSLPGPQTIKVADLQTQTLTTNADGSRDVTANPVCWSGSSQCTGANTQFGWTVALPGASEQIIYSPLLYGKAFIVNTTIPANNSPTSCQVNTDQGYTIAITAATGGVVPGFFKNTTDTNSAGSQTNGTGTPFVVLTGGNAFLLTQTLGGAPDPTTHPNLPVPCVKNSSLCGGPVTPPGVTGKRLTWVERR
jgi:type IV pilus assembly protein PilY1